MTPYQRLMARIALIRERIDDGKPARLPSWRNKPKKTPDRSPPTGGGEARSRAQVLFVSPAKPSDAVGPALSGSAPAAAVRFRKQCKAVDGVTGRQCRLLEHDDRQAHASERGAFTVVAAPGQRDFALHEALELHTVRNPEDR